MIELARRDEYFNSVEIWWQYLPLGTRFQDISFHKWVYRINGKIYPWCTAEFKEEFNKAKIWQALSD